MRVKITQPGWETYSDVLGVVKFENGVADGITRREALALGAFISVVEIDEDGAELAPVNPAYDTLMASKVSGYTDRSTNLMHKVTNTPSQTTEIENLTDDETLSQPLAEARRLQAIAEGRHQPSQATAVIPAAQPLTRDDLEAIASTKGIAGLREVAPEGVKNTSIKGLIGEILKAQRSAPKQEG